MNSQNDRRNPDRPDATQAWHAMPVRLIGEAEDRRDTAHSALSYCHTFLDDLLRGILRHDLVLIGAPSGLGKTDMAVGIATANALKECRVGYFALEAEPRELERRVKFSWISEQAYVRNLEHRHDLNYTDWLLHRCESIIGDLDAEADRWFNANLMTLSTFYRGEHFGAKDLCHQIEREHARFDLLIVDHLHYVDAEDDRDEHRSLGDTVKVVRDVSLRVGKPVILVAHLRKRDQRLKQLVPTLDDFHGSSNIAKICTQAITIERAAGIKAPKWWLAPTFMSVLKDRRAGAPPYVALTMFDKRKRRYEDTYTLGRLIKGGTEWAQLGISEKPSWSTGHTQLELELTK